MLFCGALCWMKLQRFRKLNTRDAYPGGGHDHDVRMAVRAGNRILPQGRTGLDPDHALRHPGGPAVASRQRPPAAP